MHAVIFAHACPLASMFWGMPKRYFRMIFYSDFNGAVAQSRSFTYCEVLLRHFTLVVVDGWAEEDEPRIFLDVVLRNVCDERWNDKKVNVYLKFIPNLVRRDSNALLQLSKFIPDCDGAAVQKY